MMTKSEGRSILVFFIFLLNMCDAGAQIVVEEEMKRLYFERTRRITNFWEMKDMRDVTHKDKLLMGKNRISGNISYNVGRVEVNDGFETKYEIRSAIGYYTRIRFFEEFSLTATFYQDFNLRASARWISNYTYSVARYNWKPNKFNFGYENYVNNRYGDNIQTFGDKFLEGYYFISFGHVPEKPNEKLRIDNTTNLKLIYFVRYSFKYRDAFEQSHGGFFDGKSSLGANVRYTVFKNIYLESAAYFYPEEYKKQFWDPDYTYGFGYYDYRAFRLSATYGNWAINRFPWNKNNRPNYGFLDGNFKISASYIW